MTKTQAKVEERSLTLTEEVNGVSISDQESLNKANNFLAEIKGLRKEVADTFDPIISKAHKAHAEALAQKKKIDAPLADAEKTIKRGMAFYIDEQDRKREEEEKVARDMIDAGLGDLALKEHIPQPKMEGTHTQTRWHAEVVDKEKLIKAVANGHVSTEAITPNMSYLNSCATGDKGTFNIPGVKEVRETSMVSTRRSK